MTSRCKERAKLKVCRVMVALTLPHDSNKWIKKNKNAEIEVAEVKILTS
jgi:hypothetical protein